MYIDINAKLEELAEKIRNSRGIISSEEHTKMAYIVPLIQILGYDIFNPSEVIPEYTCDFGVKKGEKVDYAICIDSNPYIIIECKDCRTSLTKSNISQLYRYFSVSSAKIAILTNGIEYLLFTDSAEQNKMDYTPFYTFNILSYNESDVDLLIKLSKDNIKTSDILSQPKLLMFRDEFMSWLISQQHGVSNKFIKYIKNNLNTFNLSNDELSSIISDVLSSYKFEGFNSDIDSSNITYQKGTKKVLTSQGVTGVYQLSDETLLDNVTGSRVLCFKFFDKVYRYTKFYQFYNTIIDYCLDSLHMSINDITSVESNKKIFYRNRNEIKGGNVKSYRDILYNAGVSAQFLVKSVIEFCDVLELDKSKISLYLLSKNDSIKLMSLSDEDKNKFLLENLHIDYIGVI